MIVGALVLSVRLPAAREASRFDPATPLLSVYAPVPAAWVAATAQLFEPLTTAAVMVMVVVAMVMAAVAMVMVAVVMVMAAEAMVGGACPCW